MLLSEFFDRVYVPRRLRGKSANSVRLYRLCITQFGRTLGRKPELADLTEDNVLAHLARRSNVSPATRNKELSELTAMWRLAAQRGYVESWPDIDKEHEPERDPIAWMADELQKLLDAAAREKGDIGGVPRWLWWTACIRLILDTGERISAVRECRWSWMQGDWMRMPAEARKGKTRDRTYRLSPSTIAVLKEIRDRKAIGDEILPWPYGATYLWKCYKKLIDRAGLPSGRQYQFHCLRKTHGSAVYAAGLDPQDALDHSDRRTTQRYLDPRFRRERDPSAVLADFLRNPHARTNSSDPQRGTA